MVHTRIEQTQRKLWLPKAPVEAIDELIQVLLQVFPGDPMECYQQVRLEIADGDVYPGKPFVHPFRRSHTAFMLLGLSQDPQCHQTIRAVGYYYIVTSLRRSLNRVRTDVAFRRPHQNFSVSFRMERPACLVPQR